MASHSQFATSIKRLGRPRTNGCEVCRSAKVKCDQSHPHCSRCARLQLQCCWPSKRAELAPTRGSSEKQRLILPKPVRQQTPDSDKTSDFLPSQHESDSDISWASPCSDLGSLLYFPVLFMHDITLDHSLVLSGDEYLALSHYQERFISDRLLKTPRWSMLGCVFQSISHIPMPMHFLIAISSMDLNRRSPRPAINVGVTRTHFRKGSEMLIKVMNHDKEPHHFSTLSSLFFLYLCMSHRDILDRKAVDQLSLAVLNYIQRYNLDKLSAGIKVPEDSFTSAWLDTCRSTEPGLIGRLLLFLVSEDSKMGFEGCGGHFANHLFGSDNLYWQIFLQQRYILERHWGQVYPEKEVMHDLQTTAVIDMGNKVGFLFHRLNELSKKTPEQATPHDPDIERGIVETETVLQIPTSLFWNDSQSSQLEIAI
ncbi:hypothetical protein N7466_009547 [Penicillium verhagenii]|uniref:uncharacterized protein n=1 Tax=Penicillium verhagenii TaxID=1562060 RepID=UPI0025457333|nr:uncharacterized protein N7466_009547 [Penicillium verhagenii]KAJ5921221.1 hypothetical protein N7466_009547 [Penicillium verhagenii]